MKTFHIECTNADDDSAPWFWSNAIGWTSNPAEADHFFERERAVLRLPLQGQWVEDSGPLIEI